MNLSAAWNGLGYGLAAEMMIQQDPRRFSFSASLVFNKSLIVNRRQNGRQQKTTYRKDFTHISGLYYYLHLENAETAPQC